MEARDTDAKSDGEGRRTQQSAWGQLRHFLDWDRFITNTMSTAGRKRKRLLNISNQGFFFSALLRSFIRVRERVGEGKGGGACRVRERSSLEAGRSSRR